MKLSDAYVRNVKPNPDKRVEIPDAVVPGMYLVVQSSGARSWAVRYRHQGRPRKLTLGSYPAIALATARELARDALERWSALLRDILDPRRKVVALRR